MAEFLLINQILIFLITVVGLWLAFWVLLANRKAKLNKIFFVVTILLVWRADLNYLYYFRMETHQPALFVIRLIYSLVTFWFISAYYFVIHFPCESEKRYPLLDKFIVILLSILSLLCLFTNLIIEDTKFIEGYSEFIPGKGANIYYAIIFLLVIFYLGALIKKYFKLPAKDKLKIQYALVGASIFGLMNIIFNIALPALKGGTYRYILFGNYSTTFLLGFTAYAIVKRELFEIKVILTDILVGVIGLILVISSLFSESLIFKIIGWIVFGLFVIFGYLLIRYSHREAKQKEILEEKVKERTKELETAKNAAEEKAKELQKKKEELEKILKAVVGRELRMVELKKKIKGLEEKLKKE